MESKTFEYKYFNFFRNFDLSGSPFTFKNNSEDKCSTKCGGILGIFFVCYIISAIIFAIFNFIEFCKEENFTLQYYAVNLKKTENLNFLDKSTSFAFGLDCRQESITKEAETLFNLSIEFKSKDNESTKTLYTFNNYRNCKQDDFLNELKDTYDSLNLKNYYCIDKDEMKDFNLHGIYTDDIFEYYTITVSSKTDTEENLEKINYFLMQNDCKLQYYFTDINIDLNDFKTPFSFFIDSHF